MSCHAGLTAPFGPTMFVPAGESAQYGADGWDVSPYGEWRWTPMGLAGRDPIVYAQIESEVHALCKEYQSDPAMARKLCETLTETCLQLSCGDGQTAVRRRPPEGRGEVLGRPSPRDRGPCRPPRSGGFEIRRARPRRGRLRGLSSHAAAREQPDDDPRPSLQFFLESSVTGNFALGKKGEVYGPFQDVAPYAMEHATGMKPKRSDFLQSSRLCATCHTVVLPNVDRPIDPARHDELVASETVPLFRKFHHHVEQATYLEWLNSEYENEIDAANPRARSCQDCHMSRGLKDERRGVDLPRITTQIAAIQDTNYPEAENLAPRDWLNVRTRDEGFRRHNFSGLNAFLLEMFGQFDDVLGVPKTDFMTGSKQGVEHAIDNFVRAARDDVASLSVATGWEAPNRATARVVVRNKAGHRFPSGVGFRRAFIELAVVQRPAVTGGTECIVWASGRTNEQGVILGADGRPLPTEFFDRDPGGEQRYQKHHEEITSPDQVQVYETLLKNAKGEFTTSFVRSCEIVKDNRLLPRGWKRQGPGPALTGRYLKATHPGPGADADPRYNDGSGSDEVVYRIELPGDVDPSRLEVRATLYYQAVPPYFLRNLFETTPDGPATRRLHYLCGNLDLKGTPFENWKLPIASAARALKPGH